MVATAGTSTGRTEGVLRRMGMTSHFMLWTRLELVSGDTCKMFGSVGLVCRVMVYAIVVFDSVLLALELGE